MKLALYSRKLAHKHIDYIKEVIAFLNEHHIEYIISQELVPFDESAKAVTIFEDSRDIQAYEPDYLISFGGDGTILDTVLLTKDFPVPVLGVNLGRLGFLSSISKEDLIKAYYNIERGAFKIEDRMLLEVNSNIPIFINENIALNDLTFLRTNSSSMIEVKVFVNGEFLNNYFADGLIVSTSSGSTGYSLSCGGPILHPSTNSFVITPIAPHNLNIRPIVLPDDVILSFEVKGRTPEFLCTLDSRITHISSQHLISVKKAKTTYKLITTNENSFLNALKTKLNWGREQF
jgi:NAD+ kinase